ncbi:hypothetical protein PANT_9c00240 [Moesziomyces antarcticus T-34]|uniref:C3H1-type domain-containing protein n=1 Tax=Pseudozyma antarctica (strain T-34) TaxID=1151754 RepID=M9LVC7_PSEA3|nr:hypothetical protein PANT_9c00240 [Moesziomyces antarcticus T-34]
MSSRQTGRGSHHGGGRGRGGGAGRDRQRGRSTFAQHRQPRDSGYAPRAHRQNDAGAPTHPMTNSFSGSLCCDYVDPNPPSSSTEPSTEPYRCPFRTHSQLALMLHKADRHLVYPEGGIEELKKHDPMHIAEQREQQRRMRQQQRRAQASAPQASADKQNAEHTDSDSDDSDQDEDDSDSSESGDDESQAPKSVAAKQDGRILDGPADATISGLNIQLDSPELIAEWINQRKKRWPTQQVLQQKLKEKEERQKRSEMIYGPRPPPHGKRPQPSAESGQHDKRPKLETNADAMAQADPDPQPAETRQDDSDSDDGAPEEVSSKAPDAAAQEQAAANTSASAPSAERQDRRPICTHFLQGRCSYGDRCNKRHETTPASASASRASNQAHAERTQRRPHPRAPPTNPFDQPDLLRQLLRNEIEKHVDAVGQAIRFIVDNDMLLHVETEEGQAEEQRKTRAKIQVVAAEASQEGEKSDHGAGGVEPVLGEPVIAGGMAIVQSAESEQAAARASLYRPASPTLRALSELKYPPEPDPLIYLDPLRRDDPKPLLPSQLVRIAKDPVLRSVLTPTTPLHPHGAKPAALERAIVSLDALPSDLYRNAAIEMILGIASTPATPGPAGLVVVSKDGRRKVSETDLFRMGLRVGGDEVLAIKKIADRLSVLLDTSLQLDEVGEQDWALLDRAQRDEMRRLHYDREADRLQRLRKLGIDI